MRTARAVAARLLLAVLLALLGAGATASPAWAHAALLHSDPHDGDVLGYVPEQVVLTFSEPVGTALGAVRVVGPDGDRVDTARTTLREGRTEVVAPLEPDLADGTYVLLWRVMSEDGHPVTGASTFSVGSPSAPGASTDAEGSDGPAAVLLPVSRGVLFAGLVLLVGGTAFVLALWHGGRALRRVRRVLWAGWGLTAAGSLAGLLLQGPYVAGLPLSTGPRLLDEVVGTAYGAATAARLALLLPAAVLLAALPRAPRRTAVVVAVPVGLGLLATSSLAGHAAAGALGAVALPADVLHLGAASVWLGGLVVLLLGVLRGADAGRLAGVLPRWSRWAAWSVVVLVVTGAFASWREVGEPGALLGTGYGRLLLGKAALVVGMLALAAGGRAFVRRHHTAVVVHASTTLDGPVLARPEAVTADVARLRRTVLLEAGTGAAVLVVTAVLVGTTPARVAYAPPFTATAAVEGPLRVQVDVEPARPGLNQLHVYYTAAGGLAVDVEEVTARLVSEAGETVPVAVPRDTLGHYEQLTVPLPDAGEWQLQLTTRTSDVDSTTTTFPLRVR